MNATTSNDWVSRPATADEIKGHTNNGRSCENCKSTRCAEYAQKYGKRYHKAYEYQDYEGFWHLCAYHVQ